MSVVANAQFTAANGTLLQAYTADSGESFVRDTAPDLEIQSNRLTPNATAGQREYRWLYTPANADYGHRVQFIAQSTGTGNIGPTIRHSSAARTFYVAFLDRSGGNARIRLFRQVAGTLTQLGSTYTVALTNGTTHTLEVRAVGNQISALLDDAVVIGPVTDGNITAAGNPGFASFQSPVQVFEYAEVDDLVVGGPLTAGTATISAVGPGRVRASATAATGGTAPITQQWERSPRGAGTWSDVAGQTSLSLDDQTAAEGTNYDYRLRYTDSAGSPATVYSNTIQPDVPTTPTGWADHFPGSSLDARYGVLTAASGSATVSDSKAVLASPATGDIAAIYPTAKILPYHSQVFRTLINVQTPGTSPQTIWLISQSGAPTADSFANLNNKALLRIDIAASGSPRVCRISYFDASGTRFEYNGGTDAWAAPSVTAFSPCPEAEFYEFRIEIDGSGERSGGLGGFRVVMIAKPQTSTTWSDAQGMLHIERTPWIQWANARAVSDLFLVLGAAVTDFDGGTTHVEYLEHACDALVHGWVNQKNQGGTWAIGHEVGHNEGLGPWSPTGTGAGVALSVGTGGAWDDAQVKDQHIVDNRDDDGLLYMFYAGSDGSVFQIGVATASSEFGPWTKDAGNPIIARNATAGSKRFQVAFPYVIRDDSEPNSAKRWKMLYVGVVDASPPLWRLFYAYAASPAGPWTLYDSGAGTDDSFVLEGSGVASAYDERGWSGPIWSWIDGRWHVYGATKRVTAAELPWDIGLALAPIGADEPISLTKHGSNPIVASHATPFDVLTADLNGVNVDIASTTGYEPDDYVILLDSTSSSEQNTKYSMTRVRKVVSSTRLELYHSLRGFTVANGSAIRRMVGWSQHPRAIRQINGSWYLFSTPFQPGADSSTYGAYMETTGVFVSTGDQTGPWVPARMQSPLMYLGQSAQSRRHSIENIALVQMPVTRGSSPVSAAMQSGTGPGVTFTTTKIATGAIAASSGPAATTSAPKVATASIDAGATGGATMSGQQPSGASMAAGAGAGAAFTATKVIAFDLATGAAGGAQTSSPKLVTAGIAASAGAAAQATSTASQSGVAALRAGSGAAAAFTATKLGAAAIVVASAGGGAAWVTGNPQQLPSFTGTPGARTLTATPGARSLVGTPIRRA